MKQYIDSLEEEIRSGFLVTRQIKLVWNIQIEMAMSLLEVCKKYDLQIWAISGTMLGAVRHKGFIPWDDDMDFVMFREDYDCLLQIAPSEFKSPIFFQCAYTEKGYYRGHSQMRYDNTTMILKYEGKNGAKFHQGIFIDIFVADGFPENKEEKEQLIEQKDYILNYLWGRNYPLRRFYSISNLIKYISAKRKLGEMASWTDIELYSYMESLHRNYPVEKFSRHCWIQFSYLARWVREKKWFEKTIWMPFETIELPVPFEYHKLLEHEYGDYMKLVKGTSTHNDLMIDIEKSYEEYLSGMKMSFLKATYMFMRSVGGMVLRAFGLRKKQI